MKPLKHTTGIDKPPRWAQRLLTWLHPEETLEEVEGDLDELYQYCYKQKGQTQATLRYVLNVVSVLPPFVHRRQRKSDYSQPFLFHPDMLSNYLKIAFRNLVKNKVYSFINIGGLAIGISVAMLIGLWIYDEISFDKYHKNYDSIGQIWQGGTDPETTKIYGNIALQYPVANVLKNNYKQYFKYVLMGWWFQDYTLSFGNNKFIKKGEFINNDAPDMLSLKMLKGSLNSLKDPHSIILAKSVSDAIFGKIDPINKALKIDNRIDVIVTGVFEDMPKNNNFAQIQFYAPWDLWVSSNDWIQKAQNNWSNPVFQYLCAIATKHHNGSSQYSHQKSL